MFMDTCIHAGTATYALKQILKHPTDGEILKDHSIRRGENATSMPQNPDLFFVNQYSAFC